MKFTRIRLTGSESLVPGSTLDVQLPNTSPTVLLGPNGSGKTLILASLEAYFGSGATRQQLADDLASSGAVLMQIELTHGDWVGHGSLHFESGDRRLNWSSNGGPTGEDVAPPFTVQDLEAALPPLESFQLLRSGRLAFKPDQELWDRLIGRRKAPFETELRGWEARLAALIGPNGNDGRLKTARDEAESADRHLRHVQWLLQELDKEKNRQNELTLQLADLIATGEMLKAEHEEILRISRLADRALRIDNWIRELKQTAGDAAALQNRIAELESSFSSLEQKFSRVAANFPDRITEFRSLRDEEQRAASEQEHVTAEFERLSKIVGEARAELDRLSNQSPSESDSRQLSLQNSIHEWDGALTQLLRERIDLIRTRDGIAQQIAHEFSEIAALSDAARDRLMAYIDARRIEAELETTRVNVLREESNRRSDRVRELDDKLKSQFPDFDKLPSNSPELLRELADRRRVLATLTADVEQLKKRKEVISGKTSPAAKSGWSVVAGAAGFGIGSLISGWDIGLFSAVVMSGATLVGFKLFHRGTEQKLESVVAHQELSLVRIRECKEHIERIEAALTPLGTTAHLDESLSRFGDYQSLVQELKRLENESQFDQTSSQPNLPDSLSADLPKVLREMPVSELERAVAEYKRLDQRKSELDTAVEIYSDGGVKAIEIARLESQLAAAKSGLSLLSEERSQRLAEYAATKARLESILREADLSLQRLPSPEKLTTVLANVRRRLEALVEESGGLLLQADTNQLVLEWNARERQREDLDRLRSHRGDRLTPEELSERQALLTEELNSVIQKLSTLDPLYMNDRGILEEAAKYTRQTKAAQDSIELNEATIVSLKRELQQIGIDQLATSIAREPSLDSLAAALDHARHELDTVEKDLAATEESIRAVRHELADIQREFVPELMGHFADTVRTLSGGAITEIRVNDGEVAVVLADGTSRTMSRLSEGMADLVWIAMRAAIIDEMGDLLVGPLVWDEPFGRLDERRHDAVRAAMRGLAAKRQIILLSRDNRFRSWGNPVEFAAAPSETAVYSMS